VLIALKATMHPISCGIAAPHNGHPQSAAITGAAKGMTRAEERLAPPRAPVWHTKAQLSVRWRRRFDGAGGSSFILTHAREHAFHFSLQNYRPALGLNKKERYARRALSTRL
jgi:hypothetical protein